MKAQAQTVIFFCRHGQTDQLYNLNPEIDNERVLTDFGKKQIQILGAYLRSFMPSAVYTSPRRRTVQTAEIIRQWAEISPEALERDELREVYSRSDYASLNERVSAFLADLVEKHAGEQIICVSHQDVIESGLRTLGVAADEAEFPCKMGECYRVVFAGARFVQATKLTPAPQR